MRFSFKKYAVLTAGLLTGGMIWAAASTAQEAVTGADVAVEKKLDGGEARKRSKFNYQLDNRPDPFYSFLAKEAKEKAKVDEIVDEETKEPLTGMRLFEPGQLRLVAVMGVQGSKIAMAEDMAGKGYTLREDMPIGKHGQIVLIKDGQVVIKETRRTAAGREINNEIVMTLKKDEEKK
jgi:Tfp pilus assembly protein PilP